MTPSLPEFSIARPERPVLKRVEGNVPREATDNLISLASYSRKLEAILDEWAEFYAGLREIYDERSVD